MALKLVRNNDLASVGSTAETQLLFTDDARYNAANPDYRDNDIVCHLIRVISGTVKFSIGPKGADCYAIPTATPTIIECRNGNLYCTQSSSGDTWQVTTCKV